MFNILGINSATKISLLGSNIKSAFLLLTVALSAFCIGKNCSAIYSCDAAFLNSLNINSTLSTSPLANAAIAYLAAACTFSKLRPVKISQKLSTTLNPFLVKCSYPFLPIGKKETLLLLCWLAYLSINKDFANFIRLLL